MTAFWGCIIEPGAKATPFVPPPDGSRLHISQVRPQPLARLRETPALSLGQRRPHASMQCPPLGHVLPRPRGLTCACSPATA